MSHSHLFVRVGGLACALPVEAIAETLRPGAIRPVAGGPRALLGLALLRGQPTPVLDLRRLLGEGDEAPPARLVRLRGERPLALAVDAVEGVRELAAGLAAEPLLDRAAEGAVDEIGALDRRVLLALDEAQLLATVADLPTDQEAD